MNEPEQNEAIAEACGQRIELWTEPSGTPYWVVLGPHGEVLSDAAPNYLHDLNAIHEVENTLTGQQCLDYEKHLNKATQHLGHITAFAMIHATAAQRAEAFLRTVGRWRD